MTWLRRGNGTLFFMGLIVLILGLAPLLKPYVDFLGSTPTEGTIYYSVITLVGAVSIYLAVRKSNDMLGL